MANSCEAYFNGKWNFIDIQTAIQYSKPTKRCVECHGEVRVHKKGGTAEHVEHKIGFEYCSLGHYYKGGIRKMHPNPPIPIEIEIHFIPSPPNIKEYTEVTKIYTPSDILWIKNVTNKHGDHAYMDLQSDDFILHFPNNSGKTKNLLNPQINDLILIRQVIKRIPVFTHIVTPTDKERVDEGKRNGYRYGRRVRVIAKTNLTNLIPISETLWKNVNFQGVSQGNVCKIETIKSINDIDGLRLNVWGKFSHHFVLKEQESANSVSAFLKVMEIDNPEISKPEAKLKLISHFVRERNAKIIEIKKQQAIDANRMKCEVCVFSFQDKYDALFIECHHLIPIGTGGERKTRLKDLALVCSNCHRMLHKKFDGQYLSIEQLKKRIKLLKQYK